ncbi:MULTISPECIES: DUF2515 family protein [unclassified Nocardioides]|uniref:DUF2515 family protein n=1 Tax=unclassified Nocardioides TaxID=2615069 RepID=UPI003622503B
MDDVPDTVAGWKAHVEGLLTEPSCAFHRNVDISSHYARTYLELPTCLKWAGMAAFASHHVRLALFPLRLDTDRAGFVDLPRSLGRRKVLRTMDVDTIRVTNNAIFDDIFWVHRAYLSGGIGLVRRLLAPEPGYASILAGFETIDRGRRVLEDPAATADARRDAEDLVWTGNVQLLEHEQRALVQPHFDRLSCMSARLVSIGAATTFEVRGPRREAAYFTSFYLTSLTRGMPDVLRAGSWPRITRYDDRWRWISTSVVPRFRRFDADTRLIEATVQRIVEEASVHAAMPCMAPRSRPG